MENIIITKNKIIVNEKKLNDKFCINDFLKYKKYQEKKEMMYPDNTILVLNANNNSTCVVRNKESNLKIEILFYDFLTEAEKKIYKANIIKLLKMKTNFQGFQTTNVIQDAILFALVKDINNEDEYEYENEDENEYENEDENRNMFKKQINQLKVNLKMRESIYIIKYDNNYTKNVNGFEKYFHIKTIAQYFITPKRESFEIPEKWNLSLEILEHNYNLMTPYILNIYQNNNLCLGTLDTVLNEKNIFQNNIQYIIENYNRGVNNLDLMDNFFKYALTYFTNETIKKIDEEIGNNITIDKLNIPDKKEVIYKLLTFYPDKVLNEYFKIVNNLNNEKLLQ